MLVLEGFTEEVEEELDLSTAFFSDLLTMSPALDYTQHLHVNHGYSWTKKHRV